MASYHHTVFGMYGDHLPVDMDGFTYTTAAEWLAARVDHGANGQRSVDSLREWAHSMAKDSRDAIRVAEKSLEEWREEWRKEWRNA